MRLRTHGVLVFAGTVGLLLAAGVLAAWPLGWASAGDSQLSFDPSPPSSVTAGGGAFSIGVRVTGVSDLGAYEWQIAYDPAVVQLLDAPPPLYWDGGFLGSSGRSVSCLHPILPPTEDLPPGNVRFGCGTVGSAPGVSGDGLLSSIRFLPVASGAPNIQFVCAGLSDPWGADIPISNVPPCVAAVTPTPGGDETPPPGATETPVPGQPTPTASLPAATATPTGPTPTPTPLPPGWEAIPLFGGCQFETWTGANGTGAADLAGLVGPAGNLIALWAQQPPPLWRGYSPQFPEVSDLGPVDQLDVLAICSMGSGAFSRPII
jgi:hypothetical protein